MIYRLLADSVVVFHLAVVGFVIGGGGAAALATMDRLGAFASGGVGDLRRVLWIPLPADLP